MEKKLDWETASINKILNQVFAERKNKNGYYSLRSFARDLGISPSYLVQLFNGNTKITYKCANTIKNNLEMNSTETEKLDIIIQLLKPENDTAEFKTKSLKSLVAKQKEDLNTINEIVPWYYDSILMLKEQFGNIPEDPQWISKLLMVSVEDIKICLEIMNHQN